MAKKRIQTIKIKDYGEPEINKLAIAGYAFGEMTPEERARALKWFKSLYSAEWPSDAYQ